MSMLLLVKPLLFFNYNKFVFTDDLVNCFLLPFTPILH